MLQAKKFMWIIFVLIFLAIVLNLGTVAYRIYTSKQIAAKSVPYEQNPKNPSAKVLFAGDSTAVGTGALDPKYSVAGRFGQDHANIKITNLGKNGYKVEDLILPLGNLKNENFDLIVLMVGGNNILQFTNLKKFEKDMSAVLDEATKKSDNVVLITTGNVGLAPFFPRPIGYLYTKRTLKVRKIATRLTKEKRVLYVDLFAARKDDPFMKDPGKYHSRDMLHPSAEGYAVWYEKLKETLNRNSPKLP